jgi:hypothetical protein
MKNIAYDLSIISKKQSQPLLSNSLTPDFKRQQCCPIREDSAKLLLNKSNNRANGNKS